jgi:proteasome lid subunit RPN8/RPN11
MRANPSHHKGAEVRRSSATRLDTAPSGNEGDTLHLPAALRERLSGMALGGYPEETCGLLIGRRTGPDTLVEDLVQASNLDRERPGDRYRLDPDAFAAADRWARERRLEIVGIWHSHPDHPAVPSPTDRARAWVGWSYLIAAVGAGGVTEVRSWRLHGDRFAEEVIDP